MLAVSCPTEDLTALVDVLSRQQVALLPAGGEGDLPAAAAEVVELLLIEVTPEGPRSVVEWRAQLASSTPLDPDPRDLLPRSWLQRHPGAYERSRQPTADAPSDEDWDEDDDPAPVQVFLPVTQLRRLPRAEWVACNELVPKQRREGRTFAPPVPTLVQLPDA